MASKRVVIVAAVAAIVIAAGIALAVYPMLNRSGPASAPGTPFISTGTIGSSIGGSWQKSVFLTYGTQNATSLMAAYGGILDYAPSIGGFSATSVSGSVPGDYQSSVIVYSEASTGSMLSAGLIYYPNSTLASETLSNLTSVLQSNSSISVTTGTVSGSTYTYANYTGQVNATQAILGTSGRILIGFVYNGSTPVSQSGMVSLLKGQISLLGSSSAPRFPSQLLTSSQANTSLSLGVDAGIYGLANITGISPLLGSYNTSLLGNTSGTSALESQFLGNMTAAGFAAYADSARNVTVGSAFVTFTSTTYSAALFEDLNAFFSSGAYSSSYHAGTIGGSQYFFVNISLGNNSTPQLSLIFCASGSSLLIQFALASSVYGYTQLTNLTSAQISDM